MFSAPPYATREAVMEALDTKVSAYQSGRIDKAIDSASRDIEGLCHRIFYPLTATKSWAYPGSQDETSTLWLDSNELYSLATFTAGGVTIPPAGYYLEPQQSGPPYDHIEINQGSNYALAAGASGPQRALSLAGVFCGCDVVETAAGTASAIVSTSTTSITLTQFVGVGSLLRIDSERFVVTEKAWTASGQTGSLTASLADQSLTVSDGTVFTVREIIMLDAEMLLILAVSGNTLIVKRAVQGSTLAVHATAGISWSRTFIVSRGAAGTTAATHSGSAPVFIYQPPALIEQLAIAYAIDRGLQETTGYARTVGQGENERSATGRAIGKLEYDVRRAHGRRVRFRAV